MNQEERKAILTRAVRTYGEVAQEDMVIEEMAELTKAICKTRRAKPGTDAWADAMVNVIEEVADVQIMLDQLRIMLGTGTEEKEEEKLIRLKERLDRHDALNL